MSWKSRCIPLLVAALATCQSGEAPARTDTAISEERGVRSREGMVSSVNMIASEVGAAVLAAGGNAVDAAIATGFALAVVHPSAGNIGGGGFMVIRFPDGSATALDFREKAPLAAHPEMFTDEDGEYSSYIHHNSYVAIGSRAPWRASPSPTNGTAAERPGQTSWSPPSAWPSTASP